MSDDLYAFRRNVVLVASAGTGKTHALVGVMLHALLGTSELRREPLRPSRMAATTFSRKAAAEIRERLVTELERLAFGGTPSAHAASLENAARRLGPAWSADIGAESARRALADVDQASIGTLHSLAYGLARTHALTVGLAPSLEVASEDDTEAWAGEAVERALEEHASARPADVRDLFRLMRGRDRAHAELVRILLQLDEDGRTAASLVLPEGDADALEAMRSRPLGKRDWPGTSERERQESFEAAWASRAQILPTAAVIRSLLTRAQAVFGEIHARAGAVGFGSALRFARDALRKDPLAAARASEAFDALLVDEFQDTSRIQVELLRLLWERAPRDRTPGSMPIAGDFRPSGLLVVGDRKQSIYAFRGADVGVFVTTCIELAGERARAGLGIPEDIVPLPPRTTADFFVLRENHRARADVIDFVNAFSREVLVAETDELFEARYVEATESLVAASGAHAPSDRSVTWLRPAGEERNTTRLEDATLAAATIADATHRDFAFRDFAVLAQTTEMLDATAFALARLGVPHVMAGRGFFAAREVQDLLWLLRWIERPDDRVALLSVLRGPLLALGDRTLLALTRPHEGLQALGATDMLERRDLVEPDDEGALDLGRRVLRDLQRAAGRIGPGPTLREAVRAFELEPMLLLLPRGRQRVANVRKLVRLADREPTVRSFLERVARAEARAREPEAATFAEDDDAVRLLTIHASKGLAFRVVIVPELRAGRASASSATFGVDLRAKDASLATKVLGAGSGEPVMTPSLRELAVRERARLRADRRRLMYVAVTRAKERLVFVGGFKPAASRAEPSFGAALHALAAAGHVEEVRVGVADAAPLAERPREVPMVTPPTVRTVEVAVAPTALQDFAHCPRRFELIHLLGAPEPTPRALGRFRADGSAEPSARALGTALHELLERIDLRALGARGAAEHARAALASCNHGLDPRAEARVIAAATRFLESDYAGRVHEAARVERERTFVASVASGGRAVTLRGAMDLVVFWPTGDIDVVDYKSARGPDEGPHALQLDVYAWALAREHPTARVRAGALFLGSDAKPEPRFRPTVSVSKLEARLFELATRLTEARAARRFPRAQPKTCHALGCGYFSLCHPPRDHRQLPLFR